MINSIEYRSYFSFVWSKHVFNEDPKSIGEGGVTHFFFSEVNIMFWNEIPNLHRLLFSWKYHEYIFTVWKQVHSGKYQKPYRTREINAIFNNAKPLTIPYWKSWNTGFYPLNKNDIFHIVKITKLLFSQFENNKLLWRQIIEYPP